MTTSFAVFPSPLKVRYKGMFDWGVLYRFAWKWLRDRHFRLHEKKHKNKTQTPLGNEIEVIISGEKEVTEYYMYKATVHFHLWESKEVPVIIDGKQVMMMRGRIEIEIDGTVITDWQGRYDSGSKVHKFMETFLNKTVFKNDITMKNIDPYDKDLHRFEAEMKKLLKMENQAPSVGYGYN